MPILFTRKFLSLGLVLSFGVQAATVSRVTSFSDGEVLFAADLESEFNNLVDNINTLDNDNLASGANISPAKLSATIAGDGLSRNGSTGILEVNDDNSTLEISGDVLQVKDAGITLAKQANLAALSVIGNGTNSSAAPTALTAGTDGHVLRRSGTTVAFGQVAADGLASDSVTTAKILDANVTKAKLAALGQQVSSESALLSASTTFQSIGSVSITTTGRPVFVMAYSTYQSSGVSNGGGIYCSDSASLAFCEFRFRRDSTVLGYNSLNKFVSGGPSGYINMPCSSLSFLDAPAAGTYTYDLFGRAVGSADLVGAVGCRLAAFEL